MKNTFIPNELIDIIAQWLDVCDYLSLVASGIYQISAVEVAKHVREMSMPVVMRYLAGHGKNRAGAIGAESELHLNFIEPMAKPILDNRGSIIAEYIDEYGETLYSSELQKNPDDASYGHHYEVMSCSHNGASFYFYPDDCTDMIVDFKFKKCELCAFLGRLSTSS